MVFVSLDESDNEETPTVVNNFLETKIELSSINIVKARRLGKRQAAPSKPRPILVTFHLHKEKGSVLAKKSSLAGTKVFINNDLTREQMQAEKQLRETKKKILQHPDYKGKKITIYRNRICVDHSPITEDMLRSAGVSILDIGQKAHSICTWNINGLTSKKFIYLFDYFTKYDIILLCETWLKPNHRYNMDIKEYKLISTYRSQLHHKAKRGSGGLMCYIKEEFQ